MSRMWWLLFNVISVIVLISNVCGQNPFKTEGIANYNLTEGEYLALEGGLLLPDAEKVAQVEKELSLIRDKFSAIKEIKHHRKWIPGQVLTTKIGTEQLALVNNSAFGPLKHIERIDVMPFFSVTVLTFDKPYSPAVLASQLESEFGFRCTPNTVYYEYEVDNITYRPMNSTYNYIFKKGTGVCNENCPARYLWEFNVDEAGDPKLVQEWVVPQDGQRVIIYKK